MFTTVLICCVYFKATAILEQLSGVGDMDSMSKYYSSFTETIILITFIAASLLARRHSLDPVFLADDSYNPQRKTISKPKVIKKTKNSIVKRRQSIANPMSSHILKNSPAMKNKFRYNHYTLLYIENNFMIVKLVSALY